MENLLVKLALFYDYAKILFAFRRTNGVYTSE